MVCHGPCNSRVPCCLYKFFPCTVMVSICNKAQSQQDCFPRFSSVLLYIFIAADLRCFSDQIEVWDFCYCFFSCCAAASYGFSTMKQKHEVPPSFGLVGIFNQLRVDYVRNPGFRVQKTSWLSRRRVYIICKYVKMK